MQYCFIFCVTSLRCPWAFSIVTKHYFQNIVSVCFHICTLRLESIKVFYLPTKCTSDCLKNNIKIYIKIALTCFGAVTPSSGSALFVLAEVTLVKIVSYGTSVCD